MKRKILLLVMTAVSLGTVTTVGVVSKKGHLINGSLTCTHNGNHYAAHEATAEGYGNAECWICCNCLEVFTEDPKDGSWADISTLPVISCSNAAYLSPKNCHYEYKNLGEHHADVTVVKTSTGMRFTYSSVEDGNLFGYGVCFQSGAVSKSILLATTGNIAYQDYGNWGWVYNLPASVGATVTYSTYGTSTTRSFEFEDASLGIEADTVNVGIKLFEVVNVGGSQFGIYNCQKVSDAELQIDGGASSFDSFKIRNDAAKFTKTYESFGTGNAITTTLSVNDFGVAVQFAGYGTPFGFGIMFGNAGATLGSRDLVAVGFDTVDHKVYGDWSYGDYVAPSVFGISVSETVVETKNVMTVFYPFSVLNAGYGLGISNSSTSFRFNFFEYVTDGSGEQFACYNRMKIDGTPVNVDCGLGYFDLISLGE